jgi:DNA-binding NtrC family response regulator
MLARFVKGDVRGLTHHKGVMGSDPLAGRKAYFSPTMVEEFLSLRVLVVDDELLIRWSIAETLTSAGHTVVEAENGAAAVQALTNSMDPFDAVFLDYRLPDSYGLKLLATIRQLSPRSPVILMTAYGSPEVTQGAFELGVYQIMSKPFELQDLQPLLMKACNTYRS